jgi:hypothetical protein
VDEIFGLAWQEAAASGHIHEKVMPGKWNVYPEMAAAGLWTTPTDLAKLVIAIQQARLGVKSGLVSPNIAQLMTTPVMNSDGLGLFRMGPNYEQFGHRGRNIGFDSLLRATKRDAVILMINTNDAGSVFNDMFVEIWRRESLGS